jgi:hypothetical protein
MLSTQQLLPFFADVLSAVSFAFAYRGGFRPAPPALADAIAGLLDPDAKKSNIWPVSEFVHDRLSASDLQRRTSLIPLLSLGSALTLYGKPKFDSLFIILVLGWIVLYYVSIQLTPALTDSSRRNLKSSRPRFAVTFVVWTLFSIGVKIAYLTL